MSKECAQETFLYIAKNFNKIDNVNSKSTKAFVATIAEGFAIKPDINRNILYLKYVYGFKSKEIAEMYDISNDLVRKKLQL